MRLGALLTPTDGADPGAIVNQARGIEAAGYTSIWSAQAIGRGFMLPDPLLALTAAAAVTTTVELGTAILQLPLYNPADVALKCHTLSQLSAGRFVLGVGAGSTEADYQVYGLAFAERFKAFDRGLAKLRASFAGDESNGIPLGTWASVQGGPRLLFGTWGRNVTRAAQQFDGWIASGMHRTPQQCADAPLSYRAAGGQRAIVSTIRVLPKADLGKLREQLQTYAHAGFDDAVVMLLPGGPSLDVVRALV